MKRSLLSLLFVIVGIFGYLILAKAAVEGISEPDQLHPCNGHAGPNNVESCEQSIGNINCFPPDCAGTRLECPAVEHAQFIAGDPQNKFGENTPCSPGFRIICEKVVTPTPSYPPSQPIITCNVVQFNNQPCPGSYDKPVACVP